MLQCQPHVANKVLDKAMVAQQECVRRSSACPLYAPLKTPADRRSCLPSRSYVQLQLLSRWDMGINNLALGNFAESAACFEQLYQGSNWSKATYI